MICNHYKINNPTVMFLSFTFFSEYSCAMKSLFRKIGNQVSGTGNHQLFSASLLAHAFV